MAEKILYDSVDGREVYLYEIGEGALKAGVCDLGARVNYIKVNGLDVALGFNSLSELKKSGSYSGATVGRTANRIAGGRFTLGGVEYVLTRNEGKNHLHGGDGFDNRFFEVESCCENSITLSYLSPDGEQGYAGNLRLTVKYEVSGSSLKIEYCAVSDKDTLWCPTNHTYFNLDGEHSGDCRNNVLSINADYYTPTDSFLVPTGEKASVKDTPFDFRQAKSIGRDFSDERLKRTNGYDHNYILNGGGCSARACGNETGAGMRVYTDLPCLQLYTGGGLKSCKGLTRSYGEWAGFCLEPQYAPNAVNMSGFEIPLLKRGEEKRHYINFEFDF